MKPRIQIIVTGVLWGALAALSYFYFNAPVRAGIFAGISAVFLGSGLAYPPLAMGIHRALGAVLNVVLSGIVAVLLTVIYVALITPFGVVLRATRSLQTTRAPDKSLPTYWIARPRKAPTPEQYRRTF